MDSSLLKVICVLYCGMNHLCFAESLNTEGYLTHPRRLCPENNIVMDHMSNLEGCRDLCEMFDSCIGFALKYVSRGALCWMKSKCALMEYSDDWTMYINMRRSKQGCTFDITPGFALYGHNNEIIESSDLQVCQTRCLMDMHCLSFDYNNVTNICFISHDSRETEPSFFGEHYSMTYYQRRCGTGAEFGLAHIPTITDAASISMKDGHCIKTYGPYGGNCATRFSDADMMLSNITEITVNHGARINRLGFKYGAQFVYHGGNTGWRTSTVLHTGEYITQIEGTFADYVNKLVFITNWRTIGPFGSEKGRRFSVGGDGKALLYISGTSMPFVCSLNFHFPC